MENISNESQLIILDPINSDPKWDPLSDPGLQQSAASISPELGHLSGSPAGEICSRAGQGPPRWDLAMARWLMPMRCIYSKREEGNFEYRLASFSHLSTCLGVFLCAFTLRVDFFHRIQAFIFVWVTVGFVVIHVNIFWFKVPWNKLAQILLVLNL